jgi:hypothetical protein
MPDVTNALIPLSLGLGGAAFGAVAVAVPRLRRSRLPAVLLIVVPLLSAAAWWRLDARGGEQLPTAPAGNHYTISLAEVTAIKVVTDRGRRVHIGTPRQPVSEDELSGDEAARIRKYGLDRKVIARTPPDPSHNCHGWVFAGGRFWVAGDAVDDILADNRYAPVAEPAAGDLAVWRDARGNVVHTGVVRSTDGGTLIESKWGALGRYVHGPDDQPFGGTCSFYRSPRRGHLLAEQPRSERRPTAGSSQ